MLNGPHILFLWWSNARTLLVFVKTSDNISKKNSKHTSLNKQKIHGSKRNPINIMWFSSRNLHKSISQKPVAPKRFIVPVNVRFEIFFIWRIVINFQNLFIKESLRETFIISIPSAIRFAKIYRKLMILMNLFLRN